MNKRIDIKTGFLCNSNCLFCVQANNKLQGNRSLNDIKIDLLDSRKRCDELVLTGGEVTIRKDFLEIISFAKSIGYKLIQIQSNGRMFANLDFCEKVLNAGATEFALAIHGHNSDIHDNLMRTPGAFIQVVKGVKNLNKLNAKIILNCVIVKQNYNYLLDISKFFVSLGIKQFQLAFVHAMGNAWENRNLVLPKISDVVPQVRLAIDYAKIHGVFVMVEAIPFCLIGNNYYNYVSDLYIPDLEVKGIDNQNTLDFKKQRIIDGKLKSNDCMKCLYNSKCEGVWKEYVLNYGYEEFKPILK